MKEKFKDVHAILTLNNTQALGIIITDNGEKVKYIYSNEDKPYIADIEFDEESNPYFKTKNGQVYYIDEFIRVDYK